MLRISQPKSDAIQAEITQVPSLTTAELEKQLDAYRGELDPAPPEAGQGFDTTLVKPISRD